MGVFRRPELEKDNPAAPEAYVGPRRRLALARAGRKGMVESASSLEDAVEALTEAAEQFVDAVPASKDCQAERAALVKAMARAKQALLTKLAGESA